MNFRRYTYLIISLLLLATRSTGHISSPSLPEGCGSCHVGHGMSGEPMLSAAEEHFCYQCHGSDENRSSQKSAGKLAISVELADLEREFSKQYRHPVEKGMGHSPTEQLPSPEKGAVTHAECVDCHNPHDRVQKSGQRIAQVAGYSVSGQYLDKTQREYEVCFKCHADKLVSGGKNSLSVLEQFALNVKSQHPVTKITRQERSPSVLTEQLGGSQTMRCSDCHTNDDADGPRGPHGSRYRFLLSGNYETDPYGDESSYAYQFCYSCHDRASILGNQSFPLHREHIEGDLLRGIKGTSCATCHSAHSSQLNPHLLEFSRQAVGPESKLGRIGYNKTGTNSGECYLSCHGHEHSPARY